MDDDEQPQLEQGDEQYVEDENAAYERQKRLEEIEKEIQRLEKIEQIDNEIALMEQQLRDEEIMLLQQQQEANEYAYYQQEQRDSRLDELIEEENNNEIAQSPSITPPPNYINDTVDVESVALSPPPVLNVNLEGLEAKLFGDDNDLVLDVQDAAITTEITPAATETTNDTAIPTESDENNSNDNSNINIDSNNITTAADDIAAAEQQQDHDGESDNHNQKEEILDTMPQIEAPTEAPTEAPVQEQNHEDIQESGEDDDKVLDLPTDLGSPSKIPERVRTDSQDSVFEDIKSIQQHRSLGETPLLFGGGVAVVHKKHESIDANVDKEFEKDNKEVKQAKETKQATQDYIKMFTTAILVLLAIFGDVLFVMARDWLETRKSRPKHLPKLIEGNEDYTEENDYREDFMGEEERKRKEAILALQKRDQRMKLLASQAKSIPRMVNELKRKGRGDDAMSLLLKNVEERKKMYGKDHKAYAHGLTQVGAFVCESGKDLGTARKCYEEALQVYKRKGVQNKKYEALLLQNLAVISRAAGNLKLAQSEAAQAIALAEEALGKDHPIPRKWKSRWSRLPPVIEPKLGEVTITPARPLSTATDTSTTNNEAPPLPPNKPRLASGSISSAVSTASHSKSKRTSLLGKLFHR